MPLSMTTLETLKNLNTLAGKISPQNNSDNICKSENIMNNGGPQNFSLKSPDHDAIKMFVGQIPRSMDENDLKAMFEEFGEVCQINVLRDKVTGQSKGCCFIMFYTRKAALDAQNALHNVKTLPGMHHPIQMKPADTENRNERKLFIGMLSRRCSESDIRSMFSPYGNIEECTILRDSNFSSKGCAFVTFTSRQSAINAIKAKHHCQTMQGCSSPLVVKFADTQKDKDQKRLQQISSAIWSPTNFSISRITPQYMTNLVNQNSVGSIANISSLNNLNPLQLQQILASTQGLASNSPALNLNTAQSSRISPLLRGADLSMANLQNLMTLASCAMGTNSAITPVNIQNLTTLAVLASSNSNGLQSSSVGSLPNSKLNGNFGNAPGCFNFSSLGLDSLLNLTGLGFSSSAINSKDTVGISNANFPQLQQSFPRRTQTTQKCFLSVLTVSSNSIASVNHSGLSFNPNVSGKQVEGPEGANVFIYHLPQEFTDADLAQSFLPFGNVISAKVFIDKNTNLSKCFGNFDLPRSHFSPFLTHRFRFVR